jgi:two-component system LytT family response regulator
MIKAMIVDDEKNSCEALQLLLERSCPEVQIVAVAYSGADALNKIQSLHPQLVFLDIEMPNMNGFQLLEQLQKIDFELIFTTSYDQYAIKAFKFSAIDYLLKPVDREELGRAVEKVSKKLTNNINQQLDILLQKVSFD